MIRLAPYSGAAAWAVFQRLDPQDWLEAQAVRGEAVTSLGLFADWRAVQGARLASHAALRLRDGAPFAVFGLSHTGQFGVAEAALLARDHALFRRELAALARLLATQLAPFCRSRGVHRIEARSWADHPTAAGFLRAVGFTHESDLPGFPPDGAGVFRQFAFLPAPGF